MNEANKEGVNTRKDVERKCEHKSVTVKNKRLYVIVLYFKIL